jgi:serine/threonine protein kinase
MSEPSLKEFVALIRKSRLLTAEEMRQLRKRASPTSNVKQLADSLTDAGLLTAWQSNQLLKGQSGFVLEKYRLLNPVGRGGMGHVFRARDDRDGQIVAIKVMARKLSNNEVLVDRFRREIKASSQLDSPHIVRAVDAGRVGNVDFMVMEYVNGDQLDRIANRIGALPVRLACEIIRQAADGLQHAHEKRMVHRDIKPSNLIVDWSDAGVGTVKVMDLGLVRLDADQTENRSVTRTGQVMGTPDYMSPEQAWDTAKADIRSDIYSLGCALFRLLTGHVPFPGDNPLQVLMARCSRDVPEVRSVRDDIPIAIQDVVSKMTRRDPGSRFQTPGEVVVALQDLCEPLTQESLRIAIRAGGDHDTVESGWSGISSGAASPDDAGYKQFLREMESGAAVDLMMSAPAGSATGTNHDTLVSGLITEPETYAGKARKSQKQSKHWLVLSSIIVSVALLIVLAITISGQPGTDAAPKGPDKPKEVAWIVPELVTGDPGTATVRAGESASVRLIYTIADDGEGGRLVVSLGDDAPAGVSLDEANGVVTWNPTSLVPPGRYAFGVQLDWSSGTRSAAVGLLPLEFIVQPGPLSLSLAKPEVVRLRVNEPFELAIASGGFSATDVGAAFRVSSGIVDGMNLDPTTGSLTWVPTESGVGRHDVRVELYDVKSDVVLADTTVRIVVAPSMLSLKLPDFPVQQVVAGERFELLLVSRQPRMLMRAVRLVLGENAPEGVQLDSRLTKLSWDIPKTVSGRVEIELIAQPAGPRIEFSPDSRLSTTIVLQVESAAPQTRIPAEADVASAEGELRELFRRELTTARTSTARAAFSARLLERSYGQPTSASDFALLNLAFELADRGNAFGLLFEIELRRSERYGTDERPRLLPSLARLRRNNLNPAQQDLMVEHCMRLARKAVTTKDYASARKFLEPADLILRKSSDVNGGRLLAADVDQALKLAESLVADDGGATDAVRLQELQRLLDAWSFVRLFDQPETLSFLRNPSATTPLVNSGRGLWKFDDQRILMESPPLDGLTGFIETTRTPTRYVIRMQIAPITNSAALIIGGRTGDDLSGYLLTLDAAGFARLQQMPGPTAVREPPTSVPLNSTLPNLVDIVGDDKELTVRVNGTQILSTRLSDSVGGQIGIISSLVRPDPGPKVDIRRPRLLVLPDRD